MGTITSTGSSTITVTYSGSVSADAIELDAQEYTNGTGSTTTWSQDVVGSSNNTTSSTTITFLTSTPSASHELYVGFARTPNTGCAGSTSGFTYDVTSPNTNLYIYDPNVSNSVSPTGAQSPAGTSIAVGALITASALTVTDSTWDYVSGGSIPLNINDAATRGSTITNTSYVYGELLFGGTAPTEQLVTTGSGTTASFIVASPQGVQGVYSSSGAVQELATYSPYGIQTISSGTRVTPFGFQGSYTDSTGLIYLINRYYDPTTDQFMSIDPDVAATNQPYVFTNDNPLNAEDPTGLFAVALMGSGPEVKSKPVRRHPGRVSVTYNAPTTYIGTPANGVIVNASVTAVGNGPYNDVSVSVSGSQISAVVNGQYTSFQMATGGEGTTTAGSVNITGSVSYSGDGTTTFTWTYTVAGQKVTVTVSVAPSSSGDGGYWEPGAAGAVSAAGAGATITVIWWLGKLVCAPLGPPGLMVC